MNSEQNKRATIVVVLFYVLIFVIWQAMFSVGLIPEYLFPSPVQVAKRLWELGVDGYLLPSVEATLVRMGKGFTLAAAIGLSIGLIMGVSPIINLCLKSLFLGLQTLPTAAWVPISLLIYGLSDQGIYFVIIMSSVPAIAIATSTGILHISPLYLRAAKTLGTAWYAMPGRVILPAALPSIVSGLKLGWTLGWHGGVSAELIKSTIGLGFLLYMGRELNDASQVMGIMVVTILFGLLLDRFFFGIIEQRIRIRWGLERKG
ncbi:ABC transporter permease [Geobacter sp.]|uniref:ABC transporter permease n=1 Tax=Geobacter sp. TaxID=46610 RepID=UPI001ACF9836|nr:ABC transporter permease [Geobacter sp.]CAG1007250.1 sulfonate transport system permease protein [Anaerolineales bacterium]